MSDEGGQWEGATWIPDAPGTADRDAGLNPIRHEATVAELRAVLADPALRETDLLVPNQVKNLAIYRDDDFIGFVSLLNGQIAIAWMPDDDGDDDGDDVAPEAP